MPASFSGFRATSRKSTACWATRQGAELDLLMLKGARRVGVEFNRADVPRVARSRRTAIDDLKLDAL